MVATGERQGDTGTCYFAVTTGGVFPPAPLVGRRRGYHAVPYKVHPRGGLQEQPEGPTTPSDFCTGRAVRSGLVSTCLLFSGELPLLTPYREDSISVRARAKKQKASRAGNEAPPAAGPLLEATGSQHTFLDNLNIAGACRSLRSVSHSPLYATVFEDVLLSVRSAPVALASVHHERYVRQCGDT